MTTPTDSSALVPLSQGGTNFAQQGSLDWVALGRMQYSTSVAILSRLSKAGIDPLTIAVGQAICHRLPIGPHGEKVLRDSMTKLTARSIGADLIWFGVGVRHVVRDLVQTSQGCSLVALCAALTEAHTIPVSALVLYEIAKLCGSPQDLLPSLEQWEALVRSAAPIFANTTFGLRINQIFKIATQLNLAFVSHPTDVAKAILSIGEVTHGSLQSVSFRGGASCSWIAAWADYVLGLRVIVRNEQGDIVYANHNMQDTYTQVQIDFDSGEESGGIFCTRSIQFLRSGAHFIQRCFRNDPRRSVGDHGNFVAGRLKSETMLSDFFGDCARLLLGTKGDEILPLKRIRRREFAFDGFREEQQHSERLSVSECFSRLLAVSIIVVTSKHPFALDCGSAIQYFVRACKNIPELHHCSRQTIRAIEGFLKLYGPEESMLDLPEKEDFPRVEDLIKEFRNYMEQLRMSCRCEDHRVINAATEQFCLLSVAIFICRMIFLLDRVVFDMPMQPTVFGLHTLHEKAQKEWKEYETSFGISISLSNFTDYFSVDTLVDLLHVRHDTAHFIHESVANLFSTASCTRHQGVVARTDGKLYIYTQLLEGLTDRMSEASKIHVGWGHIEYRARFHQFLYDSVSEYTDSVPYVARDVKSLDNIDDALQLDTTSKSIEAQFMIDEGPASVGVFYRVTTSSGSIVILPSGFLSSLRNASTYRMAFGGPKAAYTRWKQSLQYRDCVVVHGEGTTRGLFSDQTRPRLIIRPLKGNLLGRCVAITQIHILDHMTCLARTHEELELFARYVSHEEYSQRSGNISSFTLIT